jgi:hypothetical protein
VCGQALCIAQSGKGDIVTFTAQNKTEIYLLHGLLVMWNEELPDIHTWASYLAGTPPG